MKLKDASSVDLYWDSVADRWRDYHIEKNVGIYKKSEHIRLIKKWAGSLKGKRVLKTDLYEEAFGSDSFMAWLISHGAVVFGMDISRKIAQRSRFSDGHLAQTAVSDLSNCGFGSEVFDIIISNSTIDNIRDSDVPYALSELRRMLKKDGVLLLTLDNAHNPLYTLGYYAQKVLKTNGYYQSRCYSVGGAKRLVNGGGFVIEDTAAIVHIPTPFNKIALFLAKLRSVLIRRMVRRCIMVFSKMGRKKTQFLTGWFIALKLVKDQ